MPEGFIELCGPGIYNEEALRRAWEQAGRPPEQFTGRAARFLLGAPVRPIAGQRTVTLPGLPRRNLLTTPKTSTPRRATRDRNRNRRRVA